MQIGFLGILFFIFLILKLTNQIAWSWWLVTLPLWGGFILVVIILLVVLVLAWVSDYGNKK
jgi:hypothetical protein